MAGTILARRLTRGWSGPAAEQFIMPSRTRCPPLNRRLLDRVGMKSRGTGLKIPAPKLFVIASSSSNALDLPRSPNAIIMNMRWPQGPNVPARVSRGRKGFAATRRSARTARRHGAKSRRTHGVATGGEVMRRLRSNPRLEWTGARPVHHGRAAVGAGHSTAGR
jgi:hypothetical protein